MGKTFQIPKQFSNENAYIVTILDDSMLPLLEHGNKLVLDTEAKPIDGDIVAVSYDGEYYVARYIKAGGNVILQFENVNFNSIIVNPAKELILLGVSQYAIKEIINRGNNVKSA